MTARDYLGQELEIGDMVAYTLQNISGFQRSIIQSMEETAFGYVITLEDGLQRYEGQLIKIGVMANDEV